MENQFTQNLNRWSREVADGCHEIAVNPDCDMDLDFYAFQSKVNYQPELMVIGSNPGGNEKYSEMNRKRGRERREADDLGICNCNQFLANDGWGSMRSLCDLFSGAVLRPVFEEAVLTNVVYFNTGTFREFQRRMNRGGREAVLFCVEKTVELICDVVRPRHMLLMGKSAQEHLVRYFDKPLQPLLVTPAEGWNLIRETTIDGIPTYCIHHPALNHKFNTGKNQELKRKMFETIFSK